MDPYFISCSIYAKFLFTSRLICSTIRSHLSLPPATKLGQGYVFTGICHSVNRGEYLTHTPGPGADTTRDLEQTHPPRTWSRYPWTRYTPWDQVHPPLEQTPPWDQVHPPDQVHLPLGPGTHPPGPGTHSPGTRYSPSWDQVHPQDQVHFPGIRDCPLGPGTPPGPGTPLGLGTPPRTRYTPPGPGTPPPRDQVHTPPPGPGKPPRTRYTPPLTQSMLGDMVNERAVRILLECNLVIVTLSLQVI